MDELDCMNWINWVGLDWVESALNWIWLAWFKCIEWI